MGVPIMSSWTDITDNALEPGKPIRSIDAFALRNNPIAIAGGAAGAPRILDAALSTDATTAGKDWVMARTAQEFTQNTTGTSSGLVSGSSAVAGFDNEWFINSVKAGGGSIATFARNGIARLDVFASGTVAMEAGALSPGQQINFVTNGTGSTGGNRSGIVGIRVRSTVSTAHGFVAFSAEDGSGRHLWLDTLGQLRIGSVAESGGTGGAVVGTQTSDERLKDIDGPVEYGLKEVMALEPIKYSFKTAPEIKKLGFSAQKTLSVVPEAVFDTNEEVVEGDPTKLGMEYVALIPVLVNAIKEQQEMIVELKAEVAQLKIRG